MTTEIAREVPLRLTGMFYLGDFYWNIVLVQYPHLLRIHGIINTKALCQVGDIKRQHSQGFYNHETCIIMFIITG